VVTQKQKRKYLKRLTSTKHQSLSRRLAPLSIGNKKEPFWFIQVNIQISIFNFWNFRKTPQELRRLGSGVRMRIFQIFFFTLEYSFTDILCYFRTSVAILETSFASLERFRTYSGRTSYSSPSMVPFAAMQFFTHAVVPQCIPHTYESPFLV
jgi:hypothetical protein